MRVLHTLTQKPGFTGSGVYLRALLEQARNCGDQFAVLCARQGNDEARPFESSYCVEFQSGLLDFPIVGMSDVMPYPSSRWRDLNPAQMASYRKSFAQSLEEAYQEFQPDVIHGHHLWILSALAREQFPKVRLVASCHGTGLRQQSLLPRLATEIAPSLRRLDHVYCLTEEQMSACEAFGLSRSCVGAGYDPRVFSPAPSSALSEGVLYAGKIAPSKGLGELLDVYSNGPSAYSLSFAGSGHGPLAEKLSRRAADLGVKLLGRLDHAQLAEAMRAAKVFVLPSYYEGLPLVLAEAMASGCRIVVNDLPGLRTWFGEELLQSGWVRLVELPELVDCDKPSVASLPRYRQSLGQAIQDQLAAAEPQPSIVRDFLASNTWASVYQKIRTHYTGEQKS